MLVKQFPDLTDAQISRLIGTTKPTIQKIRERTHWNMSNITARDPVGLGLCNREDLDRELAKAGYAKTADEEPPASSDGTSEAGEAQPSINW